MCCSDTENVVFGSFIFGRVQCIPQAVRPGISNPRGRLFCWEVTDIQTDRHAMPSISGGNDWGAWRSCV